MMTAAPSVTILYAGIFGLFLLVLSLNIFRIWVNIAVGAESGEESWKRSERVQRSFVEFVPMCLLLMFLIEIHGAPRIVLHGLGASLVAARVLHAYGMYSMRLADLMRVVGTQITFLVLMMTSLAAIYYAVIPYLANKVI